jgi:hypothetical protein
MQRSSLSKMKNKNLVVEQRNLSNNKIGNSSYKLKSQSKEMIIQDTSSSYAGS